MQINICFFFTNPLNKLIGYKMEEEQRAEPKSMTEDTLVQNRREITEDDEDSDNESEIDEEMTVSESLCNDDDPQVTIIQNCGFCILAQVDDSYKQWYFDDLYGCIHCSTEGCENTKLNVEQLIKKHGQVHICENCNIKETTHHCQQMLCHECWSNKSEAEGRPRRVRRATMV